MTLIFITCGNVYENLKFKVTADLIYLIRTPIFMISFYGKNSFKNLL